jgi:hypothetical protein
VRRSDLNLNNETESTENQLVYGKSSSPKDLDPLTSVHQFIPSPLWEWVWVRGEGIKISPPHPASPPKRGEENGIYGWTLTNIWAVKGHVKKCFRKT